MVPYSFAVTDDWPIFGRDAPDVAWRPDPELAARSAAGPVPAGDRRADRSTRCRRAPSPTPAGSGVPPRTTSASPGTAGRREVVDLSGGPAWARWWVGGAFDYTRAATEPRAATRPRGRARSPGRARTARSGRLTNARARRGGRGRRRGACGRTASSAGDRVGILLPMLIETVVAVLALGRLGAIYTPIFSRLRGAGHRGPARRLRGVGAHHRRRVPPPRVVGAAQGRRGRGGRGGAVGASRARRAARGRRPSTSPWTPGRDAWWDEPAPTAGRARPIGDARAWTPRRPT